MTTQPIGQNLVGLEFEPREVSWSSKDTMLYALGVGAKPAQELDFLYEALGPKVLPTFAVIPGMRALGNIGKAIELDIARLLHGEQAVDLHRPLPADGAFTMTSHISEVWDKGKAAVIGVTAEFADSDGVAFTTRSTLFYFGGGGFGGESGPSSKDVNPRPNREPDVSIAYTTQEEQGALYRLSGDRVALHIDPVFAVKAGYEKPFMHGLCTYGFVGRAVLQGVCDSNPNRFRSISGRFANRVEFGDVITTNMWHTEPGVVILEAVTQDGKPALSHARATFDV